MDTNRPTILIADHDRASALRLSQALLRRGYQVALAHSGREAIQRAVEDPPDLVLLEVALPDRSGLDVCRDLRAWLLAPILLMSAEQSPACVVAGLDLGADDFLKMPPETTELLARVRSHLRRSHARHSIEPVFEVRDLRLDVSQHKLWRCGEEIHLTKTEFQLLQHLVANQGRVVSYGLLLSSVWGYGYETNTQTLRVHVKNLRRKLRPSAGEPPFIITEPGVGYRFESDASTSG